MNKPSQRTHIIQASKNHTRIIVTRVTRQRCDCDLWSCWERSRKLKKKTERKQRDREMGWMKREKNLRLCLVSVFRTVQCSMYAGWDGCRHYAWRQYVSIWYYPLFTSINRTKIENVLSVRSSMLKSYWKNVSLCVLCANEWIWFATSMGQRHGER